MKDANQLRGIQIRAARALLGWNLQDLVNASGAAMGTISLLERGVAVRSDAYKRIVSTLVRAGIRFIDDNGVALERASRDTAHASIAAVENSAAA